MPYLDVFAKFRDDVRQVARQHKGNVKSLFLVYILIHFMTKDVSKFTLN